MSVCRSGYIRAIYTNSHVVSAIRLPSA